MENSTRIKLDLVLIVILFAVLIALLLNLRVIRSEGGICQLSPLVYGANQLTEANGMELSCSCNFLTENAVAPTIVFDRHNITLVPAEIKASDYIPYFESIEDGSLRFVE